MNTTAYLLHPDQDDAKISLVTQAGEFTYADLKAAVASIQHTCRTAGVKPGDRVGILAPNSLLWVASYLAALGLGAIAVPFSTTLTAVEFQRYNTQVNCAILCLDPRLRRKYAPILPAEMTVISADAPAILSEPHHQPLICAPVDETQDAAYMFTSGTTALPRVVRITHRNLQANTDSIIASLSLTASERILAVLPFYYCFGTSLLHTHLRTGGSIVFSGPLLYPERVLDLMEAKACTGFAGVPSVYQIFLRNTSFPRRALPYLRKIQQAGGKLPEILIQELIDCSPNAEISIMYGQTEATARLSCLEPALVRQKVGSIGRGIPGVELRVLNEAGAAVAPGETGEIVARGDNISPGYLNNPSATAEKFIDGALHTGDLAIMDAEGYISIVDRKSDFIKSYGNRVSSQQVESYALELTDIVSAAAIGVPDLVRGEAIILFITLKSGVTLQPGEIIRHYKVRAAAHLVPKDVIILKELPTNANGKVVKSELKKLLDT